MCFIKRVRLKKKNRVGCEEEEIRLGDHERRLTLGSTLPTPSRAPPRAVEERSSWPITGRLHKHHQEPWCPSRPVRGTMKGALA
ncbi:hypothetical protein H5410_032472 [Solanum commersonii]|uniref:Uncharacterized protein n=1 Tax=Solanum commersonii TaxID=4109 RepID=A0A9J5YQE0_SOLCO|nr:hypothetical protein H5410_032472 [Solanum commersonii]